MQQEHPAGGAATGAAEEVPYRPHVGETRQYVRDIILGVNDGLVSIFLLVAGVVGGGLDSETVLLTAVAGGVAGAISMAAGEYLATRSQEEVFDAEIELEREHIKYHRESEVAQFYEMFRDMGVAEHRLEDVVTAFTEDDETILNAMKVMEFGLVDEERRSPYRAMVMSGVLFLAGSLPSVLPFVFTDSTGLGLTWAAVGTALGLFGVGAAKTILTRTPVVRAGLENLVIAGFGGLIAYWIGNVVGGALPG